MERDRSSIDDIVDLYRRDIDLSLIDENLKKSIEERIRALEEFEAFREELALGMARTR